MDTLFSDALRDLLTDQCTPQVVRAIESQPQNRPLWDALESSGFADAMLSESQGGAGLGLTEAFHLFAMCGGHCVPVPLGETMWARALLGQHQVSLPQGSITWASAQRRSQGELHADTVRMGQVADHAIVTDGTQAWLLATASAAKSAAGFPLDASLTWPGAALAQALPLPFVPDVRTLQACLYAAQLSGALMAVFERTFNRSMGLCPSADGNGFWMSSLYQVWRFENMLGPGEQADGHDRLYVPQVGFTTGDCDIHDMAVDGEGHLVMVNTLFSCLAAPSASHSFRPLWRPPFISRLAAEDRCHLNGLAMRDGRPGWVTAVSTSDAADGWRERRRDGGVLIDVQADAVVAGGLSMPHSPRWYRDQLWLCNSGTGEFGRIDLASGRFEPLTFCAGYLRGVAFHGDFALLGTSLPRDNKTFNGLALQEALQQRNVEPRCGIQVVDLRSGDVVHWIRFEGLVEELYDVITLPGVRNPALIGFVSDEIRRLIAIEE